MWDYVYFSDLANLHSLVLKIIVQGKAVLTRETGLLFSATWKCGGIHDLSYRLGVAGALFQLGTIKKS